MTVGTLTDHMIRDHRRSHPESLDMLMVAIHSTDADLRSSARRWFCDAINARRTGASK